MTTPTATLTDFLLARIAEDEADEFKRLAAEIAGPDEAAFPYVRDVLPKTLAGSLLAVRYSAVRLGWAMAERLPLFHELARRRALAYSSHPDFRDEWRA